MRNSLGFVLALLLSTGLATADQGRTEIGPTDTFPIVIDTPGSYVLTADLHLTNAGSGTTMIEVNADNVTLDLGGHELRGPGSDSNGLGIDGEGRTGVVIHNGAVNELGAGLSFFQGASGIGVNRFYDLVISHVGWGSGLGFSGGIARDVVVTDACAMSLVCEGVYCENCSLSNVVVRSSYKGIKVVNGSAFNCTAIDNQLGFELDRASLTGGASVDNAGNGVRAKNQSTVIGVVVSGNGSWGILLDTGGGNNAVNCAGGNNTGGNISGCGDGNGCHQNHLP